MSQLIKNEKSQISNDKIQQQRQSSQQNTINENAQKKQRKNNLILSNLIIICQNNNQKKLQYAFKKFKICLAQKKIKEFRMMSIQQQQHDDCQYNNNHKNDEGYKYEYGDQENNKNSKRKMEYYYQSYDGQKQEENNENCQEKVSIIKFESNSTDNNIQGFSSNNNNSISNYNSVNNYRSINHNNSMNNKKRKKTDQAKKVISKILQDQQKNNKKTSMFLEKVDFQKNQKDFQSIRILSSTYHNNNLNNTNNYSSIKKDIKINNYQSILQQYQSIKIIPISSQSSNNISNKKQFLDGSSLDFIKHYQSINRNFNLNQLKQSQGRQKLILGQIQRDGFLFNQKRQVCKNSTKDDDNDDQSQLFNFKSYVENDKSNINGNINGNSNSNNFLESFMTFQQSELILPQNYPQSQSTSKKISSYPQSALQTVRKYKFNTFSKSVLKTYNQSNNYLEMFTNFLSKKITILKDKSPLEYQNDSLKESLAIIPQTFEELAQDIFQQILKAGGDKPTQYPRQYHIAKIIIWIQQLQQNNQSQAIVQETYFQIIKQLQSQKLPYIQLMCAICSVIKVNKRLYIPLLNFLFEKRMLDHQGKYEKYFNYCFSHVINNFETGYQGIPSMFQLSCFCNMKKIPITISFPRQKTFFIESYTTVQQFLQELKQFYSLDGNLQLLLFLGGCLLEQGLLLSQYSKSIQRNQENMLQQYSNFKGYKGIIVLKNMMQIRGPLGIITSQKSFNLMYNYFVEQYKRGLFKLSSNDLVQIGGLILFSETGNPQNTIFQLQRLLPRKKVRELQTKSDNSQQENQEIISLRQKFKKCLIRNYFRNKQQFQTKHQARKKVLQILQNSKGFMTHFFLCQISYNQTEQYQTRIGLKWNKLLLIDPLTGRILRQILYTNIQTWGYSKSTLSLKVDNIGLLDINCNTSQSAVMISIFQRYLQYGIKMSLQNLQDKKESNVS